MATCGYQKTSGGKEVMWVIVMGQCLLCGVVGVLVGFALGNLFGKVWVCSCLLFDLWLALWWFFLQNIDLF